ncbi:AgmX/PglI C-terminal domain-containing protein [Bdellovibrio sp. HCB290]|uniref:AgmX/PglI C-terminal domain-containing protein n=1 Tax=Bdellovibrio sp. HCB290 TaxID=3394356 RepID=UPI0039B65C07
MKILLLVTTISLAFGKLELGGRGEEFHDFQIADRNAIRRTIKANSSSLRECFVKIDSESQQLTVRIKIESSGKVRSVSFPSSSIKDEKVEDCLRSTIQRISFPQTSSKEELKDFDFPIKFQKK